MRPISGLSSKRAVIGSTMSYGSLGSYCRWFSVPAPSSRTGPSIRRRATRRCIQLSSAAIIGASRPVAISIGFKTEEPGRQNAGLYELDLEHHTDRPHSGRSSPRLAASIVALVRAARQRKPAVPPSAGRLRKRIPELETFASTADSSGGSFADIARTRLRRLQASGPRLWCKALIRHVNLVAGAGFEPAAFGL